LKDKYAHHNYNYLKRRKLRLTKGEKMKNVQKLEILNNRNIAPNIDQTLQEIQASQTSLVIKNTIPDIYEARTAVGLSQQEFANLMGISKRTLQEWEQGRRVPTGAARTLIKLAIKHPEVLKEVLEDIPILTQKK
jgi:putative transcriptional regulator